MKEPVDIEPLCGRYLEALLAGQAEEASSTLQEALLQCGSSALYRDLFAPAQRAIGELWCAGEINIAQEHLATQLMLGHLERLRQTSRPRERLELRIVVGTVEGDFHFVGARIAADLFYFDGWQVDFLGANNPTRDLLDYVRATKADVVGLSATLDRSLDVAAKAVDLLRRLPHKPLVIVGGAVARAKDAARLEADLLAGGAEEAVAATRRLLGVEKPEWGLDSYLEMLGRRVQSLRKARGWSQVKLANAAGLDRTYVSSVEHGKQNLTLSVALKLADALSVPLEWLLSEGWMEMSSRSRDLFV